MQNIRWARIEASGFQGREPAEFRWDIDSGEIDCWSIRAPFNPAPNWNAQYSIAHLTSPEALHPAENLRRMTASVMCNRPLTRGNLRVLCCGDETEALIQAWFGMDIWRNPR
jgi:hypothetical protein